eukprot:scaffold3001_cov145-Pinguiococcus_pyrenoidosus.AAC.1
MRNKGGGKKTKKGAAKHAVGGGRRKLRLAESEYELYATVRRLHGQHCTVVTSDGQERTCYIRGRFRGRNRRDNFIEANRWILVGLREFSNVAIRTECDLLYVYDNQEREDLLRTVDRRAFASLLDEDRICEADDDIAFDSEVHEGAAATGDVVKGAFGAEGAGDVEISIDDL